jgi:amino acid adenylation domain-containing protein
MSAAPTVRSDALLLLGEDEARETLDTWNDTTHEAPRETTIHQLFEEQVRKTPDRLAVIDDTRQLTFRELNRSANRLAHHLRGQGVARESAVGLCADRSVEMMVGILGILKAGGAYVPLDPHSPSERSQFVIEDAAIRVVLTKEDIDAIALREDDLAAFDVDVDSGVDGAGLAYVIFTSGSTGRPKGVAIAHRSVLNLEMALRGQIPVARGRVGVNAPIVFDASVKQWIQLLNGATLVLVPEAVRQSPGQFLSFIETQALDLIDCTPSHLQILVEQGLLDSPVATTFLVGGEKIAEPLWRRLAESRSARFYNVYGPTECTVDAALAAVAMDAPCAVIGRPLWNVTLYVLDDAMRPVPVGVRGELYVGGVGLARGYAGRPDWTAERFVPNPFAATGGERLYRTGDAVRWRADGQLEYLERIDQQVKVRGYRIELGEIEAVIARHPRVAQAVVLVHEDRLVAYVTGGAGPDELRAHVAGRLPDFMVPSAFVPLEQFPTTVNGKVDRRKLLAVDAGPLASAAGYVAPRSAIELLVADITADVLGVERVGVLDDFFALGGHSLLAMQLVSRISRILKAEVPLRFVFLAPTVSGMAEVLLANPKFDSVRRIAESYQRMQEAEAQELQLAEEGARS